MVQDGCSSSSCACREWVWGCSNCLLLLTSATLSVHAMALLGSILVATYIIRLNVAFSRMVWLLLKAQLYETPDTLLI